MQSPAVQLLPLALEYTLVIVGRQEGSSSSAPAYNSSRRCQRRMFTTSMLTKPVRGPKRRSGVVAVQSRRRSSLQRRTTLVLSLQMRDSANYDAYKCKSITSQRVGRDIQASSFDSRSRS